MNLTRPHDQKDEGLHRRIPEADEGQLHALYLKRVAKCHNRNNYKKTTSALDASNTPYLLSGSFAPNRRDLDQYGGQVSPATRGN
jgi:hypothetical protein